MIMSWFCKYDFALVHEADILCVIGGFLFLSLNKLCLTWHLKRNINGFLCFCLFFSVFISFFVFLAQNKAQSICIYFELKISSALCSLCLMLNMKKTHRTMENSINLLVWLNISQWRIDFNSFLPTNKATTKNKYKKPSEKKSFSLFILFAFFTLYSFRINGK